MAIYTVSYTVYHQIEVDVAALAIELGRRPTQQDIKEQAFNQLSGDAGNIIYGGMKKDPESMTAVTRKIIRSKQSY